MKSLREKIDSWIENDDSLTLDVILGAIVIIQALVVVWLIKSILLL